MVLTGLLKGCPQDRPTRPRQLAAALGWLAVCAGGERDASRKRFLESRNAVRRQQDQRYATALTVPLKPQAKHTVAAGMKNDV